MLRCERRLDEHEAAVLPYEDAHLDNDIDRYHPIAIAGSKPNPLHSAGEAIRYIELHEVIDETRSDLSAGDHARQLAGEPWSNAVRRVRHDRWIKNVPSLNDDESVADCKYATRDGKLLFEYRAHREPFALARQILACPPHLLTPKRKGF